MQGCLKLLDKCQSAHEASEVMGPGKKDAGGGVAAILACIPPFELLLAIIWYTCRLRTLKNSLVKFMDAKKIRKNGGDLLPGGDLRKKANR